MSESRKLFGRRSIISWSSSVNAIARPFPRRWIDGRDRKGSVIFNVGIKVWAGPPCSVDDSKSSERQRLGVRRRWTNYDAIRLFLTRDAKLFLAGTEWSKSILLVVFSIDLFFLLLLISRLTVDIDRQDEASCFDIFMPFTSRRTFARLLIVIRSSVQLSGKRRSWLYNLLWRPARRQSFQYPV